jgi:hypothetical protein
MNFLNDNHIRTLPWLALSPDLNPIGSTLTVMERNKTEHPKNVNNS